MKKVVKLISDERDYKDPHLFLEMNGRTYTYYLTNGKVCTSYHPFRTRRYITKWITSPYTLAPLREFVENFLKG